MTKYFLLLIFELRLKLSKLKPNYLFQTKKILHVETGWENH